MTRRLVIEPEAEADLHEAFAWYQDQRRGLGDEFLLAVEAAFAAIRRQPEAFRTMRGEVRRVIVRRFPYGVFFVIEPTSINVLAVLHAKRNPGTWKRRRKR